MIRKQIFIEDEQNRQLKRLAAVTGKSEGALIREGLLQVLNQKMPADDDWKIVLRRLKGIWSDRTDVDEVMAKQREARRRGKKRLLRAMGVSRK